MHTRPLRALVVAALTALAVACTPSAPESVPPAVVGPTPSTQPPPPGSFRAVGATRTIGGCTIFGNDHFLNAAGIDRLAVHPRSDAWVAHLGRDASRTIHAPNSRVWMGSRTGQAFNVVDSNTTRPVDVVINPSYASNNYLGRYPIPRNPIVQGYPTPAWDRHLLIIDTADCNAYELIQYDPLLGAAGIHTALAGTRYPLSGVTPPVKTTNAAKTPMIGQSALVSEVRAGRIAHPIGFCTDELSTGHVWPARASDGRSARPDAVPMGAWFRLRSDVDPSAFSGQARVFVEALRNHGAILTDTCAHRFSLMGENSDQWDDRSLAQLETLTPADFEAVDTTAMKVADNSFEIR